MTEPKREVSKEVWLFLLSNGGRWSAAELARRLTLDSTQVLPALWYMSRRFGTVVRHGNRRGGITYEVTPRCRIPHGIELRELHQALAA